MDQIIADLVRQSPSVVAIVCVVAYFLNYLEAMESSRRELDAERSKSIKEIGESCHAFQRELASEYAVVGKEMSAALRENAKAFNRLEASKGVVFGT